MLKFFPRQKNISSSVADFSAFLLSAYFYAFWFVCFQTVRFFMKFSFRIFKVALLFRNFIS